MRRKEQEISEIPAIESVISKSLVCRLGMVDGDRPYVVPLCFGYKDRAVYVHGFPRGKKIDVLKKNPNVCVEFDITAGAVPADDACDWNMNYQSVIAFGTAVFLEDPDEKREALEIIVAQYAEHSAPFPEKSIRGTAVIKIGIDSMTGKQTG